MTNLLKADNLPGPEHDAKTEAQSQELVAADRISIASNVLLTVIRLGAERVQGVVRMGTTPGGVNRWLRRAPAERGVQIVIEDQTVTIDVYIVVDAEAKLNIVSQNVQKQVARDIEENIGMHVGAVNIHIEDVVFASQVD